MEDYRECFVAFIDILGFKRVINEKECKSIRSIFAELQRFKPHPIIKNSEVYRYIKTYIMSDSIVVYIESEREDAFVALADVCAQIQIKLSSMTPPILTRGGIAEGGLYHENNVLFGKGLTRAYLIESTLAKYPRIVFTEETRQSALKHMGKMYTLDYNHMYYKHDDDMLYYIDYMNTYGYIPALGELSHEVITSFNNAYFEGLYTYVEFQLATLTDPSVRDKYLWLMKKINQAVECRPEVKKWFDGIKDKEKEEMDRRFDAALEMKRDDV